MKKRQKFSGKPNSFLLILVFFYLFLPPLEAADSSAISTLLEFALHASRSTECLLFSPHDDPVAVSLHKRAKSTSKMIGSFFPLTPCQVVDSRENRKGEVWLQVQVSQKEAKTGWVPYDHVITAPLIFPLGGGKHILLHFQAPCRVAPCDYAHWLILPGKQVKLNLGTGTFASDHRGDLIFYDQLVKEKDFSNPSPSQSYFWQSYLYAYDVRNSTLRKLCVGHAPVVHPTRNFLYFRDLKGRVITASFSGEIGHILYTPPDPARMYIDPSGKASPILEDQKEVPLEGTVTGPLFVYVSPEEKILPDAVKFLSNNKIQFSVPYARGKIKSEITLTVESQTEHALREKRS